MNPWEEMNRATKAKKLAEFIAPLHSDLKSAGCLGEFSEPHVWIRHPSFPWLAISKAADVNPPSDETKALVLDELRRAA